MIAWFVRNRVAANLLLLGISISGLIVISGVPQETIPDFEPSVLNVRTISPGAGAEEIEETILIALEEAVRDVSGIREITGLAAEGVGLLTVVVEPWADFRQVSGDVRERVESLATLPQDAEDPVISELEVERLLLRVAVHGRTDEYSLFEAAREVREALFEVAGVAGVDRNTGRDYEISVEVSEDVLTRFGLTLDGLAAAIRRGSGDIPGGAVRTAAGEVRLRTAAEAHTAADFARIPVIASPAGGGVRVGDLATVTDGFADVERAARMNGEPAVFLSVRVAPESRLLEAAEAVHARIREIELPEGIAVTPWWDAWTLFESRMAVLLRNGISGLGLIFLVLFFTLSSRLAVWTAAGLPVAFFGCFLLMPWLGVTVNMFSLFGFILALGIVVDDAIIVGENVELHGARNPADREAAAVRGTREVLFPAAFGVLTSIAAFTPMLGLPGIWGELMGELPRIVIAVLVFSLVDAAWILPHHMAHGGLRVRPSLRLARIRAGAQAGLAWMVDRLYLPALRWALGNRLATVALAVFSLSLSLGLVAGGWIPMEVAPPFDSSTVGVQVSLPPGSTAEATGEIVERLEDAVEDLRRAALAASGVDPVRHVASSVGQRLSVGPGGPLGSSQSEGSSATGQVSIELIPLEDLPDDLTARDIGDRLRDASRSLPYGAEVSVVTSLLGEESDIAFRLRGGEMQDLRQASAALQSRIREYAGVTIVWDDDEGPAPGLVAEVRPGGAALGIGAADLGRQLRQAFHGEEVRRIQRGRDEVRVMLRYPESERDSVAGVRDMLVRRPDGGAAPIGEVAEITRQDDLSTIRRVDGRRTLTVHANVDPDLVSSADVLADVQAAVVPDLEALHAGVRFEVGGLAGDQEETFAALERNLLLALLLIYVLLAVPLGSWSQPFVVMAAVPFGLAGAVFGHLVIGAPVSMSSFFGMVPLTGIVVNDALVLLDFINRTRRSGRSTEEAVLLAGPRRFRPILLTSVTTCAGLAPLLAEQSVQAQFLVPMAASLAFGVAFATLVTLLLVPALYSLMDEAARRTAGAPDRRSPDRHASAASPIPSR